MAIVSASSRQSEAWAREIEVVPIAGSVSTAIAKTRFVISPEDGTLWSVAGTRQRTTNRRVGSATQFATKLVRMATVPIDPNLDLVATLEWGGQSSAET